MTVIKGIQNKVGEERGGDREYIKLLEKEHCLDLTNEEKRKEGRRKEKHEAEERKERGEKMMESRREMVETMERERMHL